MPSTDTITLYRGESTTINFTMSPVEDISGWDIEFNVADVHGASSRIIDGKTATIVDGAAGTFKVVLTAAETNINPRSYVYDATRVDSGFEEVLAIGTFTVEDVVRLPSP